MHRDRVVLALVMLTACDPATSISESDNESVAITEIVTLGSVDDPVLGFASVDGLAVGDHIFVLQSRIAEVTELSRSGELVRRIGHRGQGPGEFAIPSGLGLRGDTLWVLDHGNRRVSYFLDGALLFDESWPSAQLSPQEYLAGILPLAAGSFLGIVATRSLDPEGDSPDDFTLVRIEGDIVTNTVAELKGSLPQGVRLGRVHVTAVVTDFPIFIVAPGGDYVVVIERPVPDGPKARIQLTKISESGDTIFSKSVFRSSVPYTEADWNHALDRVFSAYDPPFSRAELEAASRVPKWQVPVSAARIGEDGAIWLGLDHPLGADSVVWLVSHPAGDEVFEIKLPADFRVRTVYKNEVWGVVTDDLDVPYMKGFTVNLDGRVQ